MVFAYRCACRRSYIYIYIYIYIYVYIFTYRFGDDYIQDMTHMGVVVFLFDSPGLEADVIVAQKTVAYFFFLYLIFKSLGWNPNLARFSGNGLGNACRVVLQTKVLERSCCGISRKQIK